jgi:diazepam-binding inhibitor (GABA receptor modulating acyl-CoA-binding protein)
VRSKEDRKKATVFGKRFGVPAILQAKRTVRYGANSPQPQPENPMADLKSKFEAAVANSKSLTERPDNGTLLKIYALYKQASTGDNTEKKPGFTDMVGRAKWDAWNGFKGISTKDAMQQYVDLIESLS